MIQNQVCFLVYFSCNVAIKRDEWKLKTAVSCCCSTLVIYAHAGMMSPPPKESLYTILSILLILSRGKYRLPTAQIWKAAKSGSVTAPTTGEGGRRTAHGRASTWTRLLPAALEDMRSKGSPSLLRQDECQRA